MELKEFIKRSPISVQIALLIERARQDAGFTQKELADLVEMRQGSISRLESGSHNCSVKTLEKIMRACGVEEIRLYFKGDGSPFNNNLSTPPTERE